MTRAIKVTPAVFERIVWAAKQPMTLVEIGAMVGIHENTVSRVLKRAGVEREASVQPNQVSDARVRELSELGKSRAEIAAILGCTTRTVDRSRRRLGIAVAAAPRLTPDEIAKAEALLADGASVCEAARTIGRSDKAIHRYLPGRGWNRTQIAEHTSLLRRYRSAL